MFCNLVFAFPYNAGPTNILIFAQSSHESEAHMIQISNMYNGGNHPVCINRAYILPEDKLLFAQALAYAISGKPVGVRYEDGSPPKAISGHVSDLSCKVVSIWSAQ